MLSTPRIASISVLCLTACSSGDGAGSPQRDPAPLPDHAVYRGELVLRGDAAITESASVSVAILPAGTDTPLLGRTWDLGDPAWRVSSDGLRLYFALDVRDAWPGAQGAVGERMDLVARFDPDGNPATDEQGVVTQRSSVQTGSRDLLVELVLGSQVAASAIPGGD